MIVVRTVVAAEMDKVWDRWNEPQHIRGWAFASDDWEALSAENDLRLGGKFKVVMAAKDGSTKFDFVGTYTAVRDRELIEYLMDDGRRVKVEFEETPEGVRITESFDAETENSEEIQRAGWQAILDNFKKYAESDR